MVTIRRIQRKMELTEDRFGRELVVYSETETKFLERVATLVAGIKEIISMQFFTVNEKIDNCIITYKTNN